MTVGLLSQQLADTTSTDPFVPWTRPADWLTFTDPTIGSEKIVILAAVQPSDSYLAFTISGAYTVDWGDGNASVNFAAGVKASKVLSWASYSSGTLTSRGYRQAIITITPQAGQQFTSVNFSTAHATPPSPAYSTSILDMVVAGPNISFFALGTNGTAQMHRMIERFRWVGTNTVSAWDYTFNVCASLRTFAATNGQGYDIWAGSAASMTATFQNCPSLEQAPVLYTTSALSSTASMFTADSAMRSVSLFNTSSVTNAQSMFTGCSALASVPAFDLSSVTIANSMFNGCALLTSIPAASTPALTSVTGTFSDCRSLAAVPSWDFNKVTSLSQTFLRCVNLSDTSALGHATKGITALCTDLTSAFNACSSLVTLAAMNTSGVTTMSSTFYSCTALQTLPTPSGNNWKTSACTNFLNTFNGCTALQTIPLLDTSAATNMSNMAANCPSLTSVPALNVANCTNFGSMFTSCTSLQSAPLTGGRFSISYQSCMLGAAALDAIYTGLGTASGSQTITVTGNYGASGDTPSIATGKGWTVTG